MLEVAREFTEKEKARYTRYLEQNIAHLVNKDAFDRDEFLHVIEKQMHMHKDMQRLFLSNLICWIVVLSVSGAFLWGSHYAN